MREVYLRPGDFCFGEGNLRITTMLGSCISITLWHPQLIHGGMCHYMLPSRNQPHGAPNGRYGDEAMELFMLELKKRNTTSRQYQVQVYGGGNMFSEKNTGRIDIGKNNIEQAYRMLRNFGFVVTHNHVGSFGRRRIGFDVWSGEVRVVHIDHRSTVS